VSDLIRLFYIKPLRPYNPFSADFPYCPEGGLENAILGAIRSAVVGCRGTEVLPILLGGGEICSRD
jgi:hypothetical protein